MWRRRSGPCRIVTAPGPNDLPAAVAQDGGGSLVDTDDLASLRRGLPAPMESTRRRARRSAGGSRSPGRARGRRRSVRRPHRASSSGQAPLAEGHGAGGRSGQGRAGPPGCRDSLPDGARAENLDHPSRVAARDVHEAGVGGPGDDVGRARVVLGADAQLRTSSPRPANQRRAASTAPAAKSWAAVATT